MTYILDDSIKLSRTLILTADHSTLLFLPGVFYKIKNFFFLQWVNLYMITETHICMTLPLLTVHFSRRLPFLPSQKVVTLPLFTPPFPPANFWQVPYIDFFLHEVCFKIRNLLFYFSWSFGVLLWEIETGGKPSTTSVSSDYIFFIRYTISRISFRKTVHAFWYC